MMMITEKNIFINFFIDLPFYVVIHLTSVLYGLMGALRFESGNERVVQRRQGDLFIFPFMKRTYETLVGNSHS